VNYNIRTCLIGFLVIHDSESRHTQVWLFHWQGHGRAVFIWTQVLYHRHSMYLDEFHKPESLENNMMQAPHTRCHESDCHVEMNLRTCPLDAHTDWAMSCVNNKETEQACWSQVFYHRHSMYSDEFHMPVSAENDTHELSNICGVVWIFWQSWKCSHLIINVFQVLGSVYYDFSHAHFY